MAQLLSSLPIGSKVKFGKHQVNNETPWSIVWTVVAKNHISDPAYPSNSVTLHTANVIDLRSFDAQEPDSGTDRAQYGNNRYMYSNIHQWLNSRGGAGVWWSKSHQRDTAPTNDGVTFTTGYKDRPGFLYHFTDLEYNAILDTTIRTVNPYLDANAGAASLQDIIAKLFLPSMTEVGAGDSAGAEGTNWGYYVADKDRTCTVAIQAINNTLSTEKPLNNTAKWFWWLRTPYLYDAINVYAIYNDGKSSSKFAAREGYMGVRPALNLSGSIFVSDTVDSEGCYAIVWNSAPEQASTLHVPTNIYGGKSNVISWGAATDVDGDTITYSLECAVDGGEFTQIYSGVALNYAHLVPFGTSTVRYRVKATDPLGESSGYTTSATVNVINNNAPVISGTDSNLGVKSDDFTGTYTITDANSDAVTVTEAIDGVPIRSLVATLGQAITYGVTETTWLALPNGSHTLTISATDGIDTTVRTYVFTKLVDTLKIQNTTPWVSSTMPSRIMLVITRNVPSAATFKVEVCNNGYDASPTWEDATDPVMSGLVHVFSNKTKTAANWGVLVRVTVERNGATGACYVSAIGGNFE